MKLPELLRSHNIQFVTEGQHHHATSGFINVDCPYCSRDSGRFRLGVHATKLYANCWSCGPHSLVQVLSELTGRPTRELRPLCDGLERLELVHHRQRGKLVLPRHTGELQDAHKDYLEARGLDAGAVRQLWGVRGIGIAPRMPWRLFIPIHLEGQVVSWTSRSISPNAARRYISASYGEELVNHKELLYGEDYLRHSVVICEGPLDVWRLGPGATCTFGAHFTRAQVARLVKYPVRAICYDSDDDGQRQANKLCLALAAFPGETYNLRLETGKDAASASRREVDKVRKRFIDF